MSEPHRSGSPRPQPPPSSTWLSELETEFTAERPPRVSGRRVLAAGASLALLVALLAWGLPWATGASWAGITAAFSSVPVWTVPVILLLGVAALALEAVTVRTAIPRSRYGSVLQGHAASQALALAVPGGNMLGMGLLGWILRRAGFSLAVILTGLLTASLVEMAITTVLVPMAGLIAYVLSDLLAGPDLVLPGTLGAALAAVIGSVLALGLTAIALNRRVLARLLDQLGAFLPVSAEVVLTQRDELLRLLRTRWIPLLLPTTLARVLQWAALLVAVAAVDAHVPVLLTIAIFALGRVLSLVPLTPGGAGITETLSAAALVALGVGADAAALAVLLLAVATLVVPLVGGGIAAVTAVLRAPVGSR